MFPETTGLGKSCCAKACQRTARAGEPVEHRGRRTGSKNGRRRLRRQHDQRVGDRCGRHRSDRGLVANGPAVLHGGGISCPRFRHRHSHGVITLLQRRALGRYLLLAGAVVAFLTYLGIFIAGARVAWVVHLVPVLPIATVVLVVLPETKRWLGVD